jgi:hypothetical protein
VWAPCACAWEEECGAAGDIRKLVMTVKWRVGVRDPWRNVDLAMKKLDIRTWKTSTNTGEKIVNVKERATNSMEKPRYQGSGFGWDKSYMTMDKHKGKRGIRNKSWDPSLLSEQTVKREGENMGKERTEKKSYIWIVFFFWE